MILASWLRDAVALLRPRQWVKNGIVFAPLFLAQKEGQVGAWGLAFLAAVAFCLASGAGYVLNDWRDRERDRLHPMKQRRPFAAGRLGGGSGLLVAAVALAGGLGLAFAAGVGVLALVAFYLFLQTAYSLRLKGAMILDVVVIGMGFVLRAAAGAVAIEVAISPWLVVCTFTLALFMGFCKRSNEIATLSGRGAGGNHRPTLQGYTPELLTHFTTLSAAVAVMAFLAYSLSPMTIERFGTYYLSYTLPLVVYGIFRFAMLSLRGTYSDPVDLIWRDRSFQATVLLWGLAALAIILWGRHLHGLLPGL